MTAIHPFHRIVAATVRAAGAAAVVAPRSAALAPWLRGGATTASRASRAGVERRDAAGPAPIR